MLKLWNVVFIFLFRVYYISTISTHTQTASHSTSPTGLPQGFRVSERDSINVIFHVIVPLDIWEWDETSQICLRFGHPDLGGWGFNCGLGHFKER